MSGTVRLAEGFSRIARPEYLKLSHRWDYSPTTRLVHRNKSAFEKSVIIYSLLLSFEHAIIATTHLGLQYL